MRSVHTQAFSENGQEKLYLHVVNCYTSPGDRPNPHIHYFEHFRAVVSPDEIFTHDSKVHYHSRTGYTCLKDVLNALSEETDRIRAHFNPRS